MDVRVAWSSDPGLERHENEDSVFAATEIGGLDALLVIADGMGGHASGQVASRLAVDAVRHELSANGRGVDDDRMRDVLNRANAAVYAAAKARSQDANMGTTLVVAAIKDATLHVLNCGDSPAYLFRSGNAEEVYQNHSWPAEQARAGIISPEQVPNHPMKHRLARAVGVWDHVKGYAATRKLEPGDVVMLCSDGVEEAGITIDELHGLLEHDDLQACVEAIIRLARERGAPDNVTVAVARVE
jgi:protein phosphatase